MKGVTTEMPITTTEEKAQRRLEASKACESVGAFRGKAFTRRFNTAEAVNTAHGVSIASTQVNVAYSPNIDNLNDVVICSFFAS
nr:hypothetical protein [Tanacetum cinerariifolium]